MTYTEALKNVELRLRMAGIEEAHNEARIIVLQAADMTLQSFYMMQSNEISKDILINIDKLTEQRMTRRPLAYILGTCDFMDKTFTVNESVLTPRQDTERLVELAYELYEENANISILDMCTGSGCIAICLKDHYKNSTLEAIDISKEALNTAQKNARDNKVNIEFIQSDLFNNLQENTKYDLIISNPPYIRSEVIETLQPEVRDYEPRIALEADENGLDFYIKISRDAKQYLKPNAYIMYEIGYDQAMAVTDILRTNGYTDIEVYKDYAGLDRVVKAVFR